MGVHVSGSTLRMTDCKCPIQGYLEDNLLLGVTSICIHYLTYFYTAY